MLEICDMLLTVFTLINMLLGLLSTSCNYQEYCSKPLVYDDEDDDNDDDEDDENNTNIFTIYLKL